MNVVLKEKIEDGLNASEEPAAARPPDLTLGMVRHFIRHVVEALEADIAPWQRQLASLRRGADFDLRNADDSSSLLDELAMAGDALGEALAREDSPAEVGQSILSHLEASAGAMADRRKSAPSDARQQLFLKRYGAVLHRLDDDVHSLGRTMGDLAGLAARGAAGIDPDAPRRILNRMRNLGDTTLRLIEDRIASSGTREAGKRLRGLRDDLKAWIEDRNTRLEQMQAAVDELNIRSAALRNACLMQAKRLEAGAAVAAQATDGGPAGQAAPEAMVLSAGLRALLLEARADITAPLRGE